MEHVETISQLGPFQILGEDATIKAINIRKEGGEDDKKTVIDLTIEVVTGMGPVDYIDTGLRHFLWSTEGIVRNPLVGDVTYKGLITGCRIDLGGIKAAGVEAKKISISPRDSWRAALKMLLTWDPTGTEIATLSEMLQESYPFEIEGEAALRSDPEPAKGKGKANSQTVMTFHDASEDADDTSDTALARTAWRVVFEHKKASISLVQRNMHIGYNRAARLLELMEALGLVGPMQSSGSREILGTSAESA